MTSRTIFFEIDKIWKKHYALNFEIFGTSKIFVCRLVAIFMILSGYPMSIPKKISLTTTLEPRMNMMVAKCSNQSRQVTHPQLTYLFGIWIPWKSRNWIFGVPWKSQNLNFHALKFSKLIILHLQSLQNKLFAHLELKVTKLKFSCLESLDI